MASLHGMALLLLGIGYLLHAKPSCDQDSLAVLHINEDTPGTGEKPERGTNRTYFSNDLSQKVTAVVGESVVLLCHVKNLGNRTVSWIRNKDSHVLSSMSWIFTSDERFTVVDNPKTNDWNLRIDNVQPRDAGIYECQVNIDPKICRAIDLKVLDVQAKIVGEKEVYVKKGSTISLTCIVNVQDVPPGNITWYHSGAVIDFDGPRSDHSGVTSLSKSITTSLRTIDRGGVSLETEKFQNGTTSKLLVTKAMLNDSGNYTCVSSKATPASVMVHVLNGEHPAAMQHGGTGCLHRRVIIFVVIFWLDAVLR